MVSGNKNSKQTKNNNQIGDLPYSRLRMVKAAITTGSIIVIKTTLYFLLLSYILHCLHTTSRVLVQETKLFNKIAFVAFITFC